MVIIFSENAETVCKYQQQEYHSCIAECSLAFAPLLWRERCSLSSGAWAAASPQFHPAQSFSGAYLAGRIASDDNNINLAIDYFRQALSYQPGNTLIERNLMLVLLKTGQFRDSVRLPATLRDNKDIGRIARLVLAGSFFQQTALCTGPG